MTAHGISLSCTAVLGSILLVVAAASARAGAASGVKAVYSAPQFSGFGQLKIAIQTANNKVKTNPGKTINFVILRDVELAGPLPVLVQNAKLNVYSGCKTSAGASRRCVIRGSNYRYGGFRTIPVPDAGCVLSVSNFTFSRIKGGVFQLAGCQINAVGNVFQFGIGASGAVISGLSGQFGPFVGPDANFTNCTFVNNKVSGDGAVLTAGHLKFGLGNFYFTNCRFINNTAGNGGVASVGGSGSVSFINCLFASNKAAGKGGVISASGSNITIISSNFSSNTAAAGKGKSIKIEQSYFSSSPLTLCKSRLQSAADISLVGYSPRSANGGGTFGGKVTLCKTPIPGFKVGKYWTLTKTCPKLCA